jgi:hypothetical protein
MARIEFLDKFTTDLDTIITAENVQYLGENMALCTLKHKLIYRGINFEKLYYDLVRDIHCKNNIDRHISDGYDFAQTAICFLCEYIGLPLGTVITDRLNHRVTIRYACYSLLCNMMYRKYMTTRNEFGIKRTDKSKVTEPFNDYNKETEYEKVDHIIGAMSLNSRQRTILDFYMEGFGVSEISRRMNLATSTVWRNRMELQMIYQEFIGL